MCTISGKEVGGGETTDIKKGSGVGLDEVDLGREVDGRGIGIGDRGRGGKVGREVEKTRLRATGIRKIRG